MRKHKKKAEAPSNRLGTVAGKRSRGRPATIPASQVRERADNYRYILDEVWDRLWPLLSIAQAEDDVVKALEYSRPYDRELASSATLIFRILKERQFPMRRKAQIGFLADSLAGLGVVTPRRSRDICAEERTKNKQAHHIVRYEFHVECSCGYEGHSRDHACPRCGAVIPLPSALDTLVF
jgi:hypothetical protein